MTKTKATLGRRASHAADIPCQAGRRVASVSLTKGCPAGCPPLLPEAQDGTQDPRRAAWQVLRRTHRYDALEEIPLTAITVDRILLDPKAPLAVVRKQARVCVAWDEQQLPADQASALLHHCLAEAECRAARPTQRDIDEAQLDTLLLAEGVRVAEIDPGSLPEDTRDGFFGQAVTLADGRVALILPRGQDPAERDRVVRALLRRHLLAEPVNSR